MNSYSRSSLFTTFKRHCAADAEILIPGKVHLLRRDLNLYLHKEKMLFSRWYAAMQTGYMTPEEFGRLFAGLRHAFPLGYLRKSGISTAQHAELRSLIKKQFRAMMITFSAQWRMGSPELQKEGEEVLWTV